MKSQSTLSKALRKSKEIAAYCLLSVLDISVTSIVVESVRDILLFSIVADLFSPIITYKVFSMRFLKIVA